MPNKATREMRAWCERLVEDPVYRKKFERAWRARTLDPRLELEVFHYAAGKPPSAIDVSVHGRSLEAIIAGVPLEEEVQE